MRTRCALGMAAAVVIILVVLSGIGWAEGPKTLNIGVCVPLTGPAANIGMNHYNAVQMAIENQNAKGGVTIGNQKYLLKEVARDTKFDPAVAKTATEDLVFDKKVKVIFGTTPVETSSMQTVTEPNKVILFVMSPTPMHTGPDKPYTFSDGGLFAKMYTLGGLYIKKHYPQAKKVVSVHPDLPDVPLFIETEKKIMPYFGFDWLGLEKFPMGTTDFSTLAAKVLEKKPDIVDTAGCGPAIGGISAVLVKQLRQAGFEGLVWMPLVPPPGVMEEAVPEQYLTKIVTNDFNVSSPVITKEYKDVYNQYMAKFKTKPIDFMGEAANCSKAFFEFLNTQKTMDTAVWIRDFEKYRWKGIFGHEEFWVGKPVFGINRFLISSLWVSEWTNGKLVTEKVENFPYDLFVAK